jgi:hypothetical protein
MYRWLADAVLLLHMGFIAFVAVGGFLVLRWPRLTWLHVPAFLWGALVEFTGSTCPLTPLELALRQRAGEAGYTGGFIEHYLTPLIYPGGLTRFTQIVLGALVLLINGVIYARLLARRRRGATTEASTHGV